jgi:hypothetical protein
MPLPGFSLRYRSLPSMEERCSSTVTTGTLVTSLRRHRVSTQAVLSPTTIVVTACVDMMRRAESASAAAGSTRRARSPRVELTTAMPTLSLPGSIARTISSIVDHSPVMQMPRRAVALRGIVSPPARTWSSETDRLRAHHSRQVHQQHTARS